MALRQNSIDLEIETLLQASGHTHYANDLIRSVITPINSNDTPWNLKNLVKSSTSSSISDGTSCTPWWLQGGKERSGYSESSDDSSSSLDEDLLQCVDVNGADIGDLPIAYTVEGLKPCEFPVIGIYVDKRIVSGFKYRIRMLGTKKYIFNGRALTLQGVGMGYGKRITMEGDSLNNNNNYFYSDTHPQGYGFELVGITPGEKFSVFDSEERPVAKATIESVISVNEIDTIAVKETGEVQKQVRVLFGCSIVYGSDPHGLMPLCSNNSVQMSGLMCISKEKRGKVASLSAFRDIELKHYGICSFEKCHGIW